MIVFIEGGDLIQRLDQLMSDNESSLVAARADREERSFNQSLRQQQDEAYLESLKADQEKVGMRLFNILPHSQGSVKQSSRTLVLPINCGISLCHKTYITCEDTFFYLGNKASNKLHISEFTYF